MWLIKALILGNTACVCQNTQIRCILTEIEKLPSLHNFWFLYEKLPHHPLCNRQIWSGQICLSCGSCDLFLHNFPLPGWSSWLLQGDSTSGRIRSSQLQSIVVEQYAVKSEASRWWQEVLVRCKRRDYVPLTQCSQVRWEGEEREEMVWQVSERMQMKMSEDIRRLGWIKFIMSWYPSEPPPPFTLPRENSVLVLFIPPSSHLTMGNCVPPPVPVWFNHVWLPFQDRLSGFVQHVSVGGTICLTLKH